MAQRWPVTLHANYGRGVASQDARGVVQRPQGPRVSTTDFSQAGVSVNLQRFSMAADAFLIDRSHEQVYVPDDGSFELRGPSRAYGMECKASGRVTRRIRVNGGITRVFDAFYRGTAPRVFVDGAPHVVAHGGLTATGWKGWNGSVQVRHHSGYRLDGVDGNIRAAREASVAHV